MKFLRSLNLRFAGAIVALAVLLAVTLGIVADARGGLVAFGLGAALIVGVPAIATARVPSFGAITLVSDLWNPAVWIPGVRTAVAERPSFLNTGVIVTDPLLVQIANGPSNIAQIPFLRTPNHNDEVQVENTAPTVNNIQAGQHTAAILNRVSAIGSSALSAAVSGADPLGAILATVGELRERQRNRTVLNILRGVFGFSTAPGATSAALYQLRFDAFSETGASPTAGQLIDNAKLIAALHLMGEEVERMRALGGALVMHSQIAGALHTQDQISFVRNSEGKLLFAEWKGIPVFLSDLLVRNGTTSGKVYDTYLLAPASIGMGDKPQTAQVGDVASLILDLSDAAKNNVTLYDRTRSVSHVMGTKWVGTPAGQSASNAELATVGNWQLSVADYRLCGAVCLRTNG